MRRAALAVFLLLAGCRPVHAPRATAPAPAATSAAAAPTPKPSAPAPEPAGPYPECPVILASLKSVLPDPAGLEVLEWGKPREGQGDTRFFPLRVRAKNRYGAFDVDRWEATFTGGRVVYWVRFGKGGGDRGEEINLKPTAP